MGLFLAPLAAGAVAPTAIALGRKLGMTGTDSVLASNTDLDAYSNRVGDADGYDTSQIMKNFVRKDPLSNLNGLAKHTTPSMYVETVEDPIPQATVTNDEVLGDVAHAMYEEENATPLRPALKKKDAAPSRTQGGNGGGSLPEEQNSLSPLMALAGLAALYGGYRMMRR